MASYNELNALIDAYINRNGVQAITGQILNGVLKAMVEQLGRGYTIMGAAIPTTDPGTPDGPECYFASETGTYTDFDGLQVAPGELALLCYTPSDGWTKATIYEGFQEVGATIDGNVGTPSVGVSYADGVLSFDFRNMKGNTGDAAGFGTIGADITGGVGTPGVTVESSGPATAKNLQFHFTNLKGETGVTSVVATVDNTTGTPACTVSLEGQQLTLAFTGLKGAQGDTGSSVDYPFTIVNNLTTDDATQALSAAQGVVLDGKVTQLEAKVDDLDDSMDVIVEVTSEPSPNLFDKSAATTGKYVRRDYGTLENNASWAVTDYIDISTLAPSDLMKVIKTTGYGGAIGVAFYNSSKTYTHGGLASAAVEEGDAYYRASIPATELDTAMVVANDVPSEYVPYGDIVTRSIKNNIIGTDNIKDGAITASKLADGVIPTPDDELSDSSENAVQNKVVKAAIDEQKTTLDEVITSEMVYPKNLLNLNDPDYVVGKYISNNTLYNDANYNTTGYIPVSSGNTYQFAYGTPIAGNKSMRFVCVYNENKEYLRTLSFATSYTAQSGDGYVRFSASPANFANPNAMFFYGDVPSVYIPYFAPYLSTTLKADTVDTEQVKDGAITKEKLAGVFPIPFKGFSNSGTIGNGEQVSLPNPFRIVRDYILTAKISGTIEDVSIYYGDKYFRITPTTLYKYNGIAVTEYTHGLTLGTLTTFTLEQEFNIIANAYLSDDSGGVLDKLGIDFRIPSGAIYIVNNGSNAVDVSINFFPKDITKKIWVFGDSYCSVGSDRWPKYVLDRGFKNFFLDAMSGEYSSQAFADLGMMLSTGYRPTFILWTLGMNGGADQNGAVNADWLSIVNDIEDLCSAYGIELILATVPTVPSQDHTKMNEWIRSSGHRYVDFALAVEKEGTTTWKNYGETTQLIYSDLVHPSTYGAKVLAATLIADFPEIAVLD